MPDSSRSFLRLVALLCQGSPQKGSWSLMCIRTNELIPFAWNGLNQPILTDTRQLPTWGLWWTLTLPFHQKRLQTFLWQALNLRILFSFMGRLWRLQLKCGEEGSRVLMGARKAEVCWTMKGQPARGQQLPGGAGWRKTAGQILTLFQVQQPLVVFLPSSPPPPLVSKIR